MKKHTVTFLPFDISVLVSSGEKIWEAIKEAELPLKATCGGEGTCGDCIVQVQRGNFVIKASAALPDRLQKQGFVLACQTAITENLVVMMPQFKELLIKSVATSEFFEGQKDTISRVYEHNPLVRAVKLELPSPTLEDNYSDLKRLEREFQKKTEKGNLSCTYSVMKKLAPIVRQEQGHVHVIFFDFPDQPELIDIQPASKDNKIFGIACDIGTSTVALHLIDLKSGEIVATASSLNQQIKCGEDIISRINYSQKPGRLGELQDLIILTVNTLIETAAQLANTSPDTIYYGSFSGNTTMIHLFLNIESRYIREEPYVPTFNRVPLLHSRELGLNMNNEARVHFSPAIGSYVGGDITAGLLCTPILKDQDKISMFIDAGTNGELVVGNSEWLMTCACSAGPAFEGSGIKCGMLASEGAIESLALENNRSPTYTVIGGTKPKGLCGSGLVDLMEELFTRGIIDRHGKFKDDRAHDRIIECDEGWGFLVEEGQNSFWGKDLIITERDIANLIRTKGAVYSACALLLKKVGLQFAEIEAFYIAGGFGQHLNIENAIRIGLLPDLDREKFHYVGNSSLLGAYLILLSDKNKALANDIAEKMTYMELNTEPDYMNEFTGALFLPHTDMELFPSVKALFQRRSR